MSLSSDDKGGAGGGGLTAQTPRLLPGGYAAWRPAMDVWLNRAGAEDVHKKAMSEQDWQAQSTRVGVWADDALTAALALAMGDGTGSSSAAPEPSDAVKAARKLVTASVERSRKVYGALYSALSEELRAQVAHIPSGFAFGLWDWLERKFQSTEADSVGALFAQWVKLQQTEEESFDAYEPASTNLPRCSSTPRRSPPRRCTRSCCWSSCSRATSRRCWRSRRATR
jgi:hypothetical protein